ncbi:MAG: formylglycine-generating enzyme family protein [Xenococcus sp. MO_188.B8]|nr:formylglycine-generating enzyme family protein [Xenococcus sp. MO_188.B8]
MITKELGNGVTLDMIAIPGGTFMMGSPKGKGSDSERPQHQVTIKPFFMGKYPITQAQWQAVMGNNPAQFQDSPQNPVEQVSWKVAVEFCQRLSTQTETEYRLPSEAEWEYACRARTTTPYHFGESISDKIANYGCNMNGTTSVGQFPANAFGLYDMHGNIWELCQDNWHDNYEDAPTDGSAWFSGFSTIKVIRGGSWFNGPWDCRSAYRVRFDPYDTYNDVGFRVACGGART